MTIDERGTAFMEAAEFHLDKNKYGDFMWVHERLGGFMSEDQARFMYRLHLEARRDELSHVQLDYGDRAAQIFVNGDALTVEERIAELDKLIAEAQ